MDLRKIIIKGARENNLKDVSLELPRNQLIAMTGVSGCGKTTLAFNTIYAEGQRRYVESLSTYARQFLGVMSKPDVDAIEGLSPAISIDQKTTSHNPRSTVGTVTEINDYLRLLFARAGTPYCPVHNVKIEGQTIRQMVDKVLSFPEGSRALILSPVVTNQKGTFKDLFDKISQSGFSRILADGNEYRLEEGTPELDKTKRHTIKIVVDRLVVKEEQRGRLAEAFEFATKWASGLAEAEVAGTAIKFSANFACPECGFSITHLEPRLFSFNAPIGACPDCRGLGTKSEVDVRLLVPNLNLSIEEGAITYLRNKMFTGNIEGQEFEYLCHLYDIPLDLPLSRFTPKQWSIILDGSPVEHTYITETNSGNRLKRTGKIEGVRARINRLFLNTTSAMMRDYYQTFFSEVTCPKCHGQRYNQQALAVRVGDLNIGDVSDLSIEKCHQYFQNLQLPEEKMEIAHLILKEIRDRLAFLLNVGLDYLSLSRSANTLSGGEAQRIRLATQIGTKLSGVLYVLDEPSIGLHQRDNQRLINTLKTMRDLGNTLIVVEHDEETINSADYIVDIGPGAGIHGGQIVAAGTPQEVANNPQSLTGAYLSGKEKITVPETRREGNGNLLTVKGCRENNLKNIDATFKLGAINVVTGVSGSGKSTLVNSIIGNHFLAKTQSKIEVGLFDSMDGEEEIDKVILISQEPIGRTPRSNPATYTTVFTDIRDLFSQLPAARASSFTASHFSFNTNHGVCPKCRGDGVTKVEMFFLADIYVKCQECQGKRYKDEVLAVEYKGKNISDVLEMPVEEALEFFANIPAIKRKLQTLFDVGLGYMRLGQSATTLSGGEAQRIKLAFNLQKKPTGSTLYLFDEPTTGLHSDDVRRLLKVLNRLADSGETLIIIEHNLDVIKNADHLIDLGPEGGERGGTIVFTGTPEEIIHCQESYTGQFLKPLLVEKKG